MSENLIRALSGAVYISIIILCSLNPYSYYALLFVFGSLTFYEFSRLSTSERTKKWNPLWYAFFLFGISFPLFNPTTFYFLPAVIAGWFIYQSRFLVGGTQSYISLAKPHPLGYIGLGFTAAALLPYLRNEFSPILVLGIFILIWMNDTFAYLTGRQFGKRKLAPSLSPKKSIEGFIGGFVLTIIGGAALYFFSNEFELWYWVGLAAITSITSTVGDLIQSKLKRLSGVKDSGNFIPGHGGFFDRLDSFIYTAPFAYFWAFIYFNS